MADVITDTQMGLDEFQCRSISRTLSQPMEKGQGLSGRFQNTERFGLDGQPDEFSRIRSQPVQLSREFDQLISATVCKVGGMFKRFESERNRRNASVNAIRQHRGKNTGAGERILKPIRLSPVGQIDIFFDAGGMEVTVGKCIQRVTRQPASIQAIGKSSDGIGGRFEFPNDRGSQPQTRRQVIAVPLLDGNCEPIQAFFDFVDRSTGMDVSAVTEWQ